VTGSEFEHFWGSDNLKRWRSSDLSQLTIPNSSKAFLVEVGLPKKGKWMWEFEWVDKIDPIEGCLRLKTIGSSYGRPIAMDESRNGCLVSAKYRNDPERYMNASVEQFAESLVEYQKLLLNGAALDGPAGKDVVSSFRDRLKKVDPTAFADAENVWAYIVEDLGYMTS
jgi:hypothetical protein